MSTRPAPRRPRADRLLVRLDPLVPEVRRLPAVPDPADPDPAADDDSLDPEGPEGTDGPEGPEGPEADRP
jgi:hypothetical protein